MAEADATLDQRIEIWSFDHYVSQRPQGIRPMVVGENEENVGMLRRQAIGLTNRATGGIYPS